MITLQGRVSSKTQKLLNIKQETKCSAWVFVDYASEPVSVLRRFQFMSENGSPDKQYEIIQSQLIEVIDQFSNSLNSIPQGYKTICKFEFPAGLPFYVKNLKLLDTWEYNPDSVSLATYDEMMPENADFLIEDLLLIAFEEIRHTVLDSEKSQTVSSFMEILQNKFHTRPINASIIISKLEDLGKIRSSQGNKIEFTER